MMVMIIDLLRRVMIRLVIQTNMTTTKMRRGQKTDAALRHMREWLVGIKSDGSKR